MTGADVGGAGQRVALRKESVDRNKHPEPTEQTKALVALRKESVDRNVEEYLHAGGLDRRSPQGERG